MAGFLEHLKGVSLDLLQQKWKGGATGGAVFKEATPLNDNIHRTASCWTGLSAEVHWTKERITLDRKVLTI